MNNQILYIAIAIICAYLIGSFPSAYIICRLRKGADIREIGSRNMGAMNVFYKVGFAEGLMVLALDIGKGVAAVALARWLGVPMVAQIIPQVPRREGRRHLYRCPYLPHALGHPRLPCHLRN